MASRNRSLLIAFGVAVVLAGIILVWKVRATADPDATVVSTGSDGAPVEPAKPGEPRKPTPRQATPEVPAEGSAAEGSADEGTKTYVIDGNVIRDHRKGDHAPPDLPPTFHRPGEHLIKATTTRSISQPIRQFIRECAADVPPEVRGNKPRAEGRVVIGIAATQIKITQADFQVREIAGAAEQALRECIEAKVMAMTVPAVDEEDVADYAISVNFAIL